MFDLQKNYFELLGLKARFDIDQEILLQNYIKLQQLFHPDMQVNKSNAEKILTMEYSAKLNHIYQLLHNDKKRAEYLLSLHQFMVNSDADNVKPDMAMLAEILELSEEPDLQEIAQQKQHCWQAFSENFPNNLELAAQAIIKLQYLSKI